MRGRATLRLADRTALWSTRPDNRHLPSWIEWIYFLLLTKPSRRDSSQQKMIAAANRKHLFSTLAVISLIAISSGGGYYVVSQNDASSLTDQLQTSNPNEIENILTSVVDNKSWTKSELERRFHSRDSNFDQQYQKTHLALGLLAVDPNATDPYRYLVRQQDEIGFEDGYEIRLVISRQLAKHPQRRELADQLWKRLEDPTQTDSDRFSAAMSLASIDPPTQDPQTKQRWESSADYVGKEMLRLIENPSTYAGVVSGFKPAKSALVDVIHQTILDLNQPRRRRDVGN